MHNRYLHQAQGIRAVRNAINLGVQRMNVLYPTVGGKTDTEMEAINFYFKKCEIQGRCGVAVVLARESNSVFST